MNDIFYKNGWRTPNSYSNDYEEIPPEAGIYVLVNIDKSTNNEKILYVGMSKNLKNRLNSHQLRKRLENEFDFIHIFFIRKNAQILRKEEKNIIKKYNPPYNLQHRCRG